MEGYARKPTIKTTGLADTSKSELLPTDDSFHLKSCEIGDFEWWYFDIIDLEIDCILKIVAHLGTDPLRRRLFPQLVISIKTPAKKQSLIRHYSLKDFNASTDFCDVRLRDEFRVFVEPADKGNLYHVSVNISQFSADFTFVGQIEGCKPLGDQVIIEKQGNKGAFFWVIPLPKAVVTGEFSLANERYELKNALGYHDHNYWKVDVDKRLFMDDVISGWYWGRSFAKDYTVIFMDIYFRTFQTKSLIMAKQSNIIHSSNNLIDIAPSEFREDGELKASYPAKITVRSIEKNNPFLMVLSSRQLIDKRDLLEGVNPFVKWLIKLLVSRPAYFGLLAESTIKLADEQIKGTAVYEMMSFRTECWKTASRA